MVIGFVVIVIAMVIYAIWDGLNSIQTRHRIERNRAFIKQRTQDALDRAEKPKRHGDE